MLKCILYLASSLNGPGISPGSADQYILENLFVDLTIQ